MKSRRTWRRTWRRAAPPAGFGFTLIELLVVVLIIGILAAIAVPQYFRVVERGRMSEALSCFGTLKGSQERYLIKSNVYTGTMGDLDVSCPALKYFVAGPALTGGTGVSWTATLTRSAPTPQVYGAFVVTYVGPAGTLTCSVAACTSDLLP